MPGATLEEGEASSDDDAIEDQLTYAAERIEDDTELKLHSLSNQSLWARCLCCTRHMFHSKNKYIDNMLKEREKNKYIDNR